jgi:hypothetical protein
MARTPYKVKIGADQSVDASRPPGTTSGTTTLLARCLRVGGATQPTAELRLIQGSLLNIKVSEEMARELGRHLYDEIVLTGIATWRTDTWTIIDFKIKSISKFDRVAPAVAFRELAEAAGDALDHVDAWELVQQGCDGDEYYVP